MASVWYIGRANTREAFGFTWNRYNGWSIPESEFSPSQLDALRADSGFKLNQPDGPRGLPAPSGGPVIDNMFYTYYVELMGILENLEGYGLQLTGYVGSYSELPAEAPDGAMYLTADTGVIYIRQGGAWPAEPDGVPIRGPQGLKGDKGDQGDVGPQGEQGPQGIQGVKGDKGDKGDQGDQGPQGEQGPQGIQGIQGIQGEVGPEGPPAATTIASKPGTDLPSTYPTGISVMEVGDDATWPVSFATVETVRFGTNRSYQTIVERSTARSWRRTPQGGDVGWNAWVEWGAQGPQGEQGPVGAGAPDATDTTKGSIQLAGDLSGTAAAPTVPGLAGKANSTHTHAQSEITDLVADLSDKVDNTDPRLSDARTPTAHTHAQSEITDLVADLADKVDNTDPRLSDARTPTAHTHAQSDVNGLDTALAAKADLVGGKVPQAQIPSAALTDYLGEVASQAAMLALTGQRGDWATRTDLGTDWQLIADDPTLIGSWREHTYPSSPVQSVAGRTGAVTLTTTDLTDVTTVGANVAKAADQAAARTAIGAGTSSLAIGTTAGTAAEGNDPRLADTRTPTDGTVTNSKVAANAAIALSKLATGYVQGSSNGTPATLTVWVGTEAQYTAIVTKDPNTLYFRTA